jgi:creatinine amidohydrolase
MKLAVDRDLPVPLGVQLRGLIEYGIACGELLPGARLPSVRELADDLGVAPMTVSQVYRELKDGGLIEARAGLGTFVSENRAPAVGLDPRLAALQRRLDDAIEDALALGLGPGELATMITARFSRRSKAPGAMRRIVMVGLFADATRGYARAIAERLDGLASVVPTTVDALDRAGGRALCEGADLVVTFANQRRAVAARLPAAQVTTISFIPGRGDPPGAGRNRSAGPARADLAGAGVSLDHEAWRAPVRAACALGAGRSGRHRGARSGAVLVGRGGDRDRCRERRPAAARRPVLDRLSPHPRSGRRRSPSRRAACRRSAGRSSINGRERRVNVSEMNWSQIEAYLQRDDRAILPLGSTEQHAGLSLSVDSILSHKVALDAADPLGIPVFPAVPYGLAPYFLAYPGTISLRVETYARLIGDILDSLAGGGFRRILMVNGHGGNQPAHAVAIEWMTDHPAVQVRFHNWWNAPKTFAKVQEIDAVASHASWMENFPWTRLEGVAMPAERKPMIDLARMRLLNPAALRAYLGDGNFGGYYQRPDEEMLAIWQVAVEETRELLEGRWA